MKELIAHTEFLILRHEYVIIPDFGGFVLNREPASIYPGSGYIMPPCLSIGFNAGMKFNDGLLAESYMQKYNISYDSALHKIEYSVRYIKALLGNMEVVSFGSLGVFRLQDGHVLFEPSSEKIQNHPSVWGFSDVRMERLENIIAAPVIKKRRYKLSHVVAGVASTAAAVLLWTMSATINDNVFQTMQQSGFFAGSKTRSVAKAVGVETPVSPERDIILDELGKQVANPFSVMPVVKETEQADGNSDMAGMREKRYYIIIGGDANQNRAMLLAEKFRADGFSSAAIVDAPDRFRVYIASFRDVTEANAYLSRFKAQFPDYSDAWVFSKTVTIGA